MDRQEWWQWWWWWPRRGGLRGSSVVVLSELTAKCDAVHRRTSSMSDCNYSRARWRLSASTGPALSFITHCRLQVYAHLQSARIVRCHRGHAAVRRTHWWADGHLQVSASSRNYGVKWLTASAGCARSPCRSVRPTQFTQMIAVPLIYVNLVVTMKRAVAADGLTTTPRFDLH